MSRAPWNNVFLTGRYAPPSGRSKTHHWPSGSAECSTVIKKEIRIDDALPDVRDFDLSTKEGFLRDFDQVERSMLSARGQLTEDITKEYLDTASKKNRSQKKQ